MEQTSIQSCDKTVTCSVELSREAMRWLLQSTVNDAGAKTANSHYFLSLLSRAKTYPHKDETFRRPQLLQPGQVQLSEIKLCEDWHFHRKRLHNMLEVMDKLQLISLCSSRVATVITFPCVKGWAMPDGSFVTNPAAMVSPENTQVSTEQRADKEQE